MLTTFDQITRRILHFPAVFPCQNVNPTTLLHSILSLSNSITKYQPESFPTQRRNAREAIRQVTILSMFVNEIINQDVSSLPDSAIFCFCELHYSFQKIEFLLKDCTRSGARLYILMKSHVVTNQFLTVIRAIATALDILPLSLFKVSRDVEEMVDMVKKQASTTSVVLDCDDEYAVVKQFALILNRFENRFQPDPIMIRQALCHIRISSWSECHNEVMFLNEEISLCLLENNGSDLHLLHSLAGFMQYCRGVLFENSFVENMHYQIYHSNEKDELNLSCLNPEDFRCPISLELMMDPVTVSTGQTYDRVSIQKWLNSGNLICPKTGGKLATTELVPNSNLRKVIRQYCVGHGGVSVSRFQMHNRDISSTSLPGSVASAEAIKLLSEYLVRRLCNGTAKQKNSAAYEIRLLAKSSIFNRFCLIEAGVIPPLLTLLSSSDLTIQENAIAGLLKLSKHSNGKKAIIDHNGLSSIVSVLKNGLKQECKQAAAATIFYLSSIQTNRKLIGEIPEAIPALIEQVRAGTSCGRKNSLAALFLILQEPRNHETALSLGIIPLLSTLISTSEKPEIVTDSLSVVAALAESFDGSDRILKDLSLALIINTLKKSASKECCVTCVSILLALSNNWGDKVIAVLASEPNLMSLLYSLSVTAGSQAGKKARALFRIVNRFHVTSGSGSMVNWDSSRFEPVRSC
ncbi:putative U box domain, armadillo-like helical, Zinc finger, RING/FYVE/PHD-type [Helianthus debilis subsp. tardiflorus]